jgi:hypothetical protein
MFCMRASNGMTTGHKGFSVVQSTSLAITKQLCRPIAGQRCQYENDFQAIAGVVFHF